MEFLKTQEFAYIVIPLLIFFLRVLDVSLGTLRIIFVSKGYKTIAPVIGFFEVLIWIFAISRIMQNMNNWLYYFAYAGGFSAGTYVGMMLEKKLAIGHELIRVITKKEARKLFTSLKNSGFNITTINAEGVDGPVAVLYIIVRRKHIGRVVNTIKLHNPRAVYTIEGIRALSQQVSVNHHQNVLKRK